MSQSKYAMSGGHEITLAAAQSILDQGGNAFDAAISAYFTSFVAEPCMASAGAGGFANIYTSTGEQIVADFFCQTPEYDGSQSADGLKPITVDFGTSQEVFYAGPASMGVPGAILFIYQLHERYATLPMEQLMAFAKNAAIEGVELNTFQSIDFSLLEDIFRMDDSVQDVFFNTDGTIKQEGDLIQLPQYADFLDRLLVEGPDLMYTGDIARQIVDDVQAAGGVLTLDDLKNYKVNWSKPLKVPFDDYTINLPPESSTGSWILANIFKDLQGIPKGKEFDIALAKSFYKLAHTPTDLQVFKDLYSDKGIDQLAGNNAIKGTSHFNIVDQWGNAIALTTSIGEGSGYFIPGTHMQMNNMLGEPSLLPNGIGSWLPSQRLNSMMCPVVITDAKFDLNMILGSGGAGRIPYVIAQVILNSLKHHMELQESIIAPRLFIDKEQVHYEKGFDLPLIDILSDALRWDEPSLFFGGVHAIQLDDRQNYISQGDFRRFGVVNTSQ